MNATHQFAVIHVNKRCDITNIEMAPPVTLPKAQIKKLLSSVCPQYRDFELEPRNPANSHCITSVIVFEGEEQNALLSWANEPIDGARAYDFYSSVPKGSIIGAMKSKKTQNKFFRAAGF